MKHARLLGAAVLWMSACATQLDACLSPPITDGADAQGVLSGTVVFDGPAPVSSAPGAGNTLIFLYAENAPPPPSGSGRPVTFAVLPRAALFGGAPAGTLRSAPFVIPQVPPGRYSVRGFVDMDGDFDPFVLTRASATRGDVGGGLVDLGGVIPVFPSVEVKAGEATSGITVTLSAARGTFPSDAPAFALVDPPVISAAATLPTRLRLAALQFSTDAAAAERQGLAGAGTPGLPVTFGDLDGDGVADDSDGDGFKDVYPRVLLRRLADNDATLLKDDPALTTIPCLVDPSALLDAWPPPEGVAAQGLWARGLEVLCLPVAVNASVSPPVPLPSIPGGRYALLVITALGQVWRVPNEYGPAADPVGRGRLDAALETQGAVVTVSADAPPPGSLNGLVTITTAPTGPAWVLVFDAAAPPPPSGSGRPVASARLPAGAFTEVEGRFSAPYRVAGIPPGNWLVTALLDQDNSLDIRVEVLSQASRGDVLAPLVPVAVDVEQVTVDLQPSVVVPADPPMITARRSQATSWTGGVLGMDLQAAVLSNALFARVGVAPEFGVGWRSGSPLDGDGDGLPDVWPRTVLTLVERDAADTSGVALGAQVLLASAVDVAPLGMALGNAAGGPQAAQALRFTAAPAAYEVSNPSQPQALPSVPAGTYALTLLTELGQVARPVRAAPELAAVAYLSAGVDQPAVVPDARGLFVTVPPGSQDTGGVEGTLRVATASLTGPAYVLLFDEQHPGPPDGAGLPVAVQRVSASLFVQDGAAWVAPYAFHHVAPGTYVVQALLDQDGDFSLLGSLRSTGTSGDVVGAHVSGGALPVVAPVAVAGDVVVDLVVTLARTLPLGPPAFKHGAHGLDRPLVTPRPLALEALRDAAPAVAPNGAVSLKPEEVSFAVTLRDANGDGVPDDADHDGLPDLYPRVVLQQVADAAGLETAMGAQAATLPVMLDPARYLPALLSGVPAVVTQQLHGMVLPLSLDGNGARGPVREGRYATAVASLTGQTWRVPNRLAPSVSAAGGGVASQGVLLDVTGAPALPGGVRGTLVVPAATCADVVVVVRDASVGADGAFKAPAGLTVARATRDAAWACVQSPGSYQVGNLAPGTYVVQAFADVDGDFHPFVGTLKGPSKGDLGGGALSGPTLRAITVDNAVVDGVDVELPQVVPLDLPAFRFANGAPVRGPWNGAPVRTTLQVAGGLENALSHVAAASNAFTTSTGASVTWPKVLLARLDAADTRGLRLKEPVELMVGQVDTSLFTGAVATSVEVVITPVRVSSALLPLGPATPGRYAVVVVNATGQSWQLPNELDPHLAVGGTGLPGSEGQGAVWTVE